MQVNQNIPPSSTTVTTATRRRQWSTTRAPVDVLMATEATSAAVRGLSTGWETWRAFWFQPQQMYTLGFVRIAFSALVIVWTLWLLPVRKALLGPDGISTAQPSIPDTWGLFAVWNSDEAILR